MKSSMFRTTEGVRQGGGLSPLLFITFMDDIIKETRSKTNPMFVGYRQLNRVEITECAFADDVLIIANNEKSLKQNIEVWNHALEKKGMKLNKTKTKVMMVAKEKEEINICIEGTKLEQVDTFQYLGIMLEEKGDLNMEINNRIEKTNKLYYAMNKGFLSKREIGRETKMKVFKTIYRPVLTYACESWVLTTRQKSKLQATEMKYLRRVKGVTRLDRLRNEEIRKELEINSIHDFIEQRQLSWWGHLQRMGDRIPVKRVWEARSQGRGTRGRPKETWDNVIRKILEKRGRTLSEAKLIARDRKKWWQFVHGQ